MQALDRKLWRDLIRLWGGAIAIALVVACGIACFVMAMSAYESLQLSQETYYDRYRFAEVFANVKRAPESLLTQIEAIPGVDRVQSRIVVDVNLDIPDRAEPATGRLISLPRQNSPLLNAIFLRRGRDLRSDRDDEILVSEAFATANQLELGDRLGAVLNGRWQRLRIVGIALSPEYIYEVRGAGELHPDNKRFGVLWMNRQALGNAFDLDGAFNDLTLTLTPTATETDVIDRLDRLLDRYGGLGAYGRQDQMSHRIISDEIVSLEAMATMLPTIFLAIATFLLHIVLSRLVGTQREQIGVLKAFGYRNGQIARHYLKFVLAIVSIGSGLGIFLGIGLGNGLTQLYAEYFRFPILTYRANPALIIQSVAIGVVAAAIGGVLPVYRAAALPPAVAMRAEPPAEYKPTLIERWGLQRFFSTGGRMILRNLERKPVQAVLSIIGIGVAVAILMTGRYFSDAMNYLIELQFRHVQREDMTIVFNEPRPARTQYEVAQLPGVLRSEPFRIVSARLQHQHYRYRTGLTGIDPEGELRRLIEEDLTPVKLPSHGVVVTTKLAEILHLEIGDRVTVEVLEGERPIREVTLVGTVDEMLGINAYLDIDALNQFMREGQTISGAYLMVDDQFADELYARLKEIPAVTGISTREAMLNSFEEISGKNMKVFTGILVIFASVITFSVIYNTARIALSERGRELASLRIMGFTRREVAFIFLGEQAVLTFLSLPIGFLMGYGLAALTSQAYNNEMYRIPLIITRSTYAFTMIVVVMVAIASGALISRQLHKLNLIEVLKTRE